MPALLNRARMSIATTGTGTVTLGSAITGFLSLAEAGAGDATAYPYVIEDGDDFEIGIGTYTSSGTTFSRDTVTASKISGTAGTSKINLSGSANIFLTARAADILNPANNLSDVASAATSVINLGLGTPTGTGNVVLATSPTLVTPALGVASCTSLSSTSDITVTKGGANGGYIAYVYGTGKFPYLNGRAARGSVESPSALQSSDIMMRFGGAGYGATAMQSTSTALVEMGAEENFTDTAQGTYLAFRTTPTGSTSSSERVRIAGSGNVGIGTGSPSTTLHVNGPIRCASYTVATLPSASTVGAGARAFVTDANATTFNSTVAAGGSNAISVTSDGTNWKIG